MTGRNNRGSCNHEFTAEELSNSVATAGQRRYYTKDVDTKLLRIIEHGHPTTRYEPAEVDRSELPGGVFPWESRTANQETGHDEPVPPMPKWLRRELDPPRWLRLVRSLRRNAPIQFVMHDWYRDEQRWAKRFPGVPFRYTGDPYSYMRRKEWQRLASRNNLP